MKAVLFDADGVIQGPGAVRREALGDVLGPGRMSEVQAFLQDMFVAEKLALTSPHAFNTALEAVLRKWECRGNGEDFLKAWKMIDVRSDLVEVIRALRRSGISCCLASNQESNRAAHMNYEHEFTNASYIDIGNGIKFPTGWHSHTGWDDNFNSQNISAGHNGFGGTMKDVKANVCPDPVTVPDAVRNASFPVRVESRKLADGVYLLGGSSHNSVAVEFKDFIAVYEAPLNEERNLAVIEEIVKLIPNKPIRFVINSHQHFDHADVRLRHSAVYFGSDEVLLQLRVLGEDGIAVSGSGFHVHDQAAHHDDGRTGDSVRAQGHSICFAGAVVWCGVGRPVDWVFLAIGVLEGIE